MSRAVEAIIRKACVRSSLPKPALRRSIRERAGLSQAEIAKVLGFDHSELSRYESGKRKIRGARLEAYASLLDRLQHITVRKKVK
jgi:predicted transcriptional regulator